MGAAVIVIQALWEIGREWREWWMGVVEVFFLSFYIVWFKLQVRRQIPAAGYLGVEPADTVIGLFEQMDIMRDYDFQVAVISSDFLL